MDPSYHLKWGQNRAFTVSWFISGSRYSLGTLNISSQDEDEQKPIVAGFKKLVSVVHCCIINYVQILEAKPNNCLL